MEVLIPILGMVLIGLVAGRGRPTNAPPIVWTWRLVATLALGLSIAIVLPVVLLLILGR